MSFFDDSHVTDVGLEGYGGPATGAWDFFKQSVEEQFRVNSQQALHEEIRNRWLENLELYQSRTGRVLEQPDSEMSDGYLRYLDQIEGKESSWLDQFDLAAKAGAKRLELADLTIRQLGDPNIKSFSDIVQEVYAMQRETEETSARMAARAGVGATVAGFAGSAIGSFSPRDPINLATLPIGGGGRTIATRIATEMLVGGAVTAATDVVAVLPNRERAGLEERSLLFDVAAGAVGAGVLRGAFEGISAGVRALPATQRRAAIRELEETQFNQRDIALRAMLETLPQSPRARAGLALLDDAQALEKANPYGDGPTAEARFYAELRAVGEALSGKSMTAVAQLLPPIPSHYIDKAVDFKIVKEQSPAVWAKLEEAQSRLVLSKDPEKILFIHGGSKFDEIDPSRFGSGEPGGIRPLGNGLYGYVVKSTDREGMLAAISGARHYAEKYGRGEKAVQIFEADTASSQVRFNGPVEEGIPKAEVPEAEQAWLDAFGEADKLPRGPERTEAFTRAEEMRAAAEQTNIQFKLERLPGGLLEAAALDPSKMTLLRGFDLNNTDDLIADAFYRQELTKAERRKLNTEYKKAYDAVAREAEKLNRIEALRTGKQQAEAVDLLGYPTAKKPFLGPIMRHDIANSRIEEISRVNEQIPERVDHIARAEVDEETGLVDIGLKSPIPKDFKVPFDDGDLTVEQVLNDFVDDDLLDEAMRSCLL